MVKLADKIYFQIRHLTGKVKQEIIIGEVEEEIYKGKIYKAHFPKRKGSISIQGRVFVKEGKKIFDAPAKLESRGDATILTITEEFKESTQQPIVEIFRKVTATVTPFSLLPQFDIEVMIEKYDLSIYSASLASTKKLIFTGDFLSFDDTRLEVVDVFEENLKLKEVD